MVKDAMDLRPGDLVRIEGRLQRVYAPSDVAGWGTVLVHTDALDYERECPFRVEVEDREPPGRGVVSIPAAPTGPPT